MSVTGLLFPKPICCWVLLINLREVLNPQSWTQNQENIMTTGAPGQVLLLCVFYFLWTKAQGPREFPLHFSSIFVCFCEKIKLERDTRSSCCQGQTGSRYLDVQLSDSCSPDDDAELQRQPDHHGAQHVGQVHRHDHPPSLLRRAENNAYSSFVRLDNLMLETENEDDTIYPNSWPRLTYK